MDVEAGAAVRRAGRESNVLLLKWGRWRCGGVETAREKDEDDKRSWRVFRGDLVGEMARMALRKDRGPRVDSPIGVLGRVVGIPSKEDVVGHLGDVRKDLGRSSVTSVGHIDSSLNRTSIRHCTVVLYGTRLARKSK